MVISKYSKDKIGYPYPSSVEPRETPTLANESSRAPPSPSVYENDHYTLGVSTTLSETAPSFQTDNSSNGTSSSLRASEETGSSIRSTPARTSRFVEEFDLEEEVTLWCFEKLPVKKKPTNLELDSFDRVDLVNSLTSRTMSMGSSKIQPLVKLWNSNRIALNKDPLPNLSNVPFRTLRGVLTRTYSLGIIMVVNIDASHADADVDVFKYSYALQSLQIMTSYF
ncbi:hypothetical protein SAICODRAFT_27206 [Saitoella complicata NRRL Y-17804]|uniref:uncharacterized protein n=1 Tax=Saitoella complicata (strain BCRC 22490 / CBS 7301 / JCM 7358 / NBRC 10748 / NRRL Y-17804) TaxID=698492 RepID=UPI000867BC4B|nr:uncharacterized protein SAICODRAFT_27206 [Saitoella complicata NRRL Y-17804]ODQ50836.1 hypothetical protein SAICODRAFT_27206 [Saitoella complicata NRRL Y-17804]